MEVCLVDLYIDGVINHLKLGSSPCIITSPFFGLKCGLKTTAAKWTSNTVPLKKCLLFKSHFSERICRVFFHTRREIIFGLMTKNHEIWRILFSDEPYVNIFPCWIPTAWRLHICKRLWIETLMPACVYIYIHKNIYIYLLYIYSIYI